jgi:hypothetical protein
MLPSATPLRIRPRVLAASALAASLLVASPRAHATLYQVLAFAQDMRFNDGRCSWREAILASSNKQPVDACPAGTNENEIYIVGDATPVELTRTEDIEIKGDITITGSPQPGFRQAINGAPPASWSSPGPGWRSTTSSSPASTSRPCW